MKKSNPNKLIYSTDRGRGCPDCGHPVKQCCCSKAACSKHDDGVVRVSRQTKGRKGSGVCLVTGVPLAGAELKLLARKLKQKCGSGGTVKNGVIEIQGDHREVLVDVLRKLGYTTKLAGG